MLHRCRKAFHLIYLLNFLLALSWALPTYAESTYLGQYLPVRTIGLFLAIATAAILPCALVYPRVIQKYTNHRVLTVMLAAEIACLLPLAFAGWWWLTLPAFIGFYVTGGLLAVNIDIMLEDISDDAHTGRLRTNLLLAANAAWVISPLLMGVLAWNEQYGFVFLAAAMAIMPAMLLLTFQERTLGDRFRYRNRGLRRVLFLLRKNPNLSNTFLLALALRFFYFIMVMYVPLHLHENLGFSWPTIGWILSVMLLPFLILQAPAGRIADRFLGEQEIMVTGLVIMMAFTGLLFFLSSAAPVVWAAVLFMTRVGASLVEAMQETYFFKQVSRKDVDLINIFRNLGPAGWLVAALFSSAVLLVFPLPYLFLFLAALILFALKPALALEDTR